MSGKVEKQDVSSLLFVRWAAYLQDIAATLGYTRRQQLRLCLPALDRLVTASYRNQLRGQQANRFNPLDQNND